MPLCTSKKSTVITENSSNKNSRDNQNAVRRVWYHAKHLYAGLNDFPSISDPTCILRFRAEAGVVQANSLEIPACVFLAEADDFRGCGQGDTLGWPWAHSIPCYCYYHHCRLSAITAVVMSVVLTIFIS